MNSEDMNTTEKTLTGGRSRQTENRAGGNAFLFVCNVNAASCGQIYGAVVKISQDETGQFQTGGIVKTGSPGLAGSCGAFERISPDCGRAVFSQVQRYFTGVHCEPLPVTTKNADGAGFLFAVNARLSKANASPYPLFIKARKPLSGEVKLPDAPDAAEYE